MKVYLASDHGGYQLKEYLKQNLKSWGHQVEDVGNTKLDPEDDYPDFVLPLAQKVAQEPGTLGLVIGRSGNGEVMAANKVKSIRAAHCLTEAIAKKARNDNNANILALGADFLDKVKAERILKVFLDTPFSREERHQRRVGKISLYESA